MINDGFLVSIEKSPHKWAFLIIIFNKTLRSIET